MRCGPPVSTLPVYRPASEHTLICAFASSESMTWWLVPSRSTLNQWGQVCPIHSEIQRYKRTDLPPFFLHNPSLAGKCHCLEPLPGDMGAGRPTSTAPVQSGSLGLNWHD